MNYHCQYTYVTISRVYHIEVEYVVVYKVEVSTIMDKRKKVSTERIRREMAEEGWEMLGEYVNKTTHFLVRHPDLFDGHLLSTNWQNWRGGYRPGFGALLDKTEYIRCQFAKEGWILLDEHNVENTPVRLRHPDFFNGYIVSMRWKHWQLGHRPSFKAIVDKQAYIEEEFAKDGWEVLNKYVNDCTHLEIRYPEKFNSFTCRVTWQNWKRWRSVNTKAIIDKTGYRKAYLLECGYTVDENWEYKTADTLFPITNILSGKQTVMTWNRVALGDLPGTPKNRIRNCMRVFYTRRQAYKGKTPTDLFNDEYWEQLRLKLGENLHHMTIDHLVPMSFFENTWEQMRIANDPRNLRLLTKSENSRRGNKLRASELDEYDLWDLYYQAENPFGYKLIEDRCDLAS